MTLLADDSAVIQRILDHIDNQSTDRGPDTWREPVTHYRDPARLHRELTGVLRRTPTPFCPSAALPEPGSYLARDAAGVPLLAVRARDGQVRVFRNACRHRGMRLAAGHGCATAFTCGYHGWVYGQDGALRHVPHRDGFPDLDTPGLAPVSAVERHGLIFVTQDGPAEADVPELAGLLHPGLRLHRTVETEIEANWKIVMDGFLEGYHLRATHRDTFYAVQFDNLNVVEHFGRNSRVAFPYRAIHHQRERAPAERSADGVLTYVYHLFPNTVVATFPNSVSLIVNDPVAVDRTVMHTYVLSALDPDTPALKRAVDLQLDGLAEDQAVARSIQRGLAAEANDHFHFGHFEAALTHLHRNLRDALAD
jgi:phenylpropionate dioxygenase-like ring-hydroxylating dioxygenase large terminal subunit